MTAALLAAARESGLSVRLERRVFNLVREPHASGALHVDTAGCRPGKLADDFGKTIRETGTMGGNGSLKEIGVSRCLDRLFWRGGLATQAQTSQNSPP